jgi:hypothetical protein
VSREDGESRNDIRLPPSDTHLPERQQLALQLQDAALHVMQRLVNGVDLALDLVGVAGAALVAGDGGDLDERTDQPADAGERPAQQRRRRPPPLRPGRGARP